jgi:hypothetical protein
MTLQHIIRRHYRGCGTRKTTIRIHVTAGLPSAPLNPPAISPSTITPAAVPAAVPVAVPAAVPAAWIARVVGGLLAVSEALPFIDNDSNGLAHAIIKRVQHAKDGKETGK